MLPLIRLPECPHCGTKNQGTRAKGGNSVRCSGCGTMRRVPMYRRTMGDDDPRATRPVRGRPLPPGHPWRFQPGNRAYAPARPASAPRTGSPAARPGKPGKSPTSGMDTLKELISRLAKNPETVLQLTTEVGDGSDCVEVVRLAEVFDNKYPQFGLYWEASKNWKSVKFWIDRSEYTAPAPKFQAPRANITQPPRRMPNQSRPAVVTPKPTYVNPDTCAHPGLSYDHMADAYRCPDCSYARPAWT